MKIVSADLLLKVRPSSLEHGRPAARIAKAAINLKAEREDHLQRRIRNRVIDRFLHERTGPAAQRAGDGNGLRLDLP